MLITPFAHEYLYYCIMGTRTWLILVEAIIQYLEREKK